MRFEYRKSVSLKYDSRVNEAAVQSFIFSNPGVLGLGKLRPIMREKEQSSGGRIEVLLSDDDNNRRFEVEVQLGDLNPDHLVRTIEYWSVEKQRYPQYDHCAVLIAEDVSDRMMNVLAVLNGNIPLVVIKLSAFVIDDQTIQLAFTTIINRLSLGTDEEENATPTDREYWESASSKKVMDIIDLIHQDIAKYAVEYELQYKKQFIGLGKDGVSKNFIFFVPRRAFLYIRFKMDMNGNLMEEAQTDGMEIEYKNGCYQIRINNESDYSSHKAVFDKFIRRAAEAAGLL